MQVWKQIKLYELEENVVFVQKKRKYANEMEGKPRQEKKKKHVCEGSLQVSGKGPTMECMTLQLSGSYTKDSKVQLFQPPFIDRLKTQMWILVLWKRKRGREYFCEHTEMNGFLKENAKGTNRKGKIFILYCIWLYEIFDYMKYKFLWEKIPQTKVKHKSYTWEKLFIIHQIKNGHNT